MEKKGLKKEAKMLRIVMECFSTEIFYYESLSLLSSFQEKIRKGKDKKMIENVERIFLNVDDHLGLSFSLLCSLEGVLANFFKRRKERRGEKKWEFIRRERRKEEEGTAEEAEEIVKDLRKVGKIFEEEMNCELAWFAKEKEEEEKEGEERKEIKERKERKERKEEKREEEEEEEEEKDLQLRIGEIYLELLPLMMKEYGIFLSGKYLFQSSLDHLIRSKEPFRSFRTSKDLPLESLLIMPVSRLPRYSLLLSDTLRSTSSQQEKILLQCYFSGYTSWGKRFNSFISSPRPLEVIEKIGENKLAKNIPDFWGAYLPNPSEEEEEREKKDVCWPYSEKTLVVSDGGDDEWISQCSSVLQIEPKNLIQFVNILDELRHETLSFENKVTKEGKNVTSFCEIFLEFSPRLADLFSQWSSCLVLFVDSLKELDSSCDLKEESLFLNSLKNFFSNIFQPLARLVMHVGILRTLNTWGGVKKKEQEILSKTLVCYQQLVDIPADSFGKLNKKGRLIKKASRS